MGLEAGFRIGGRDVLPLEGRIVGTGGSLRVEPKAMAVLLELARHAPAARSREQIVAAVWPRGYVTDDVLTRCISQLRRALGGDARSGTVIETLPRVGYRLQCAVESRAADVRSPAGEALIVLPFQSLSASDADYLADGITELLILRLSALRNVRVISRTSAMKFKGTSTGLAEIAALSGADWVVEGSVLQAGDQLQVVAQLIDARTDAHVWAADYVRDLRDLLSLQNEIVKRVATAIGEALGAQLESPRVPPRLPPDTMREYLRGRQLVGRRTVAALHEARALCERVTSAAPDFAPGWASMADCELLLAHYGAPGQERLVAECEQHLERALTLDPNLGIGLAARGATRLFFHCDVEGAAKDLERALTVMPSHSMAMLSMANVCAVRGHFEEATAWIEQALVVDPLDIGINMNLGDHMILQRRPADAVTALRRALQLDAGHRPSQLRLCWALALAGAQAEAAELLEGIAHPDGADPQWHEFAALVAAASNAPDRAAQHYTALRDIAQRTPVLPWTMARAAAAAGAGDDAIDFLAQAVRERASSVPFMRVTPAFDVLHGAPGFETLAESLPQVICRRVAQARDEMSEQL